MSLSDKQWEFLKDVALLIHFAERRGDKLTGGELWRSPETQELYFDSGRSKTTNGFHQKRLAIDFNLFVDGEYMTETEAYKDYGEFWENIRPENRWGGNFSTIKDGNHFERYK